jgi:hypothetical protein
MPEPDLTPPKEGLADYGHAAARAVIASIPVVGGAAVELFDLIIAPPIVKRRNEFMEGLAQKLNELASNRGIRLEELKDNPAFIDTVLQATQAAIRTHQDEKREALRNAVLNSALPDSPDASTQLMFISMIDRFTEWHLRILDLFRDPRQWAARNGVSWPDLSMGGAVSQILLHAFPGLNSREAFYRQVWADLNNSGLLNTPVSSLGTTMSGHGLMEKRTTQFGDQFLRFITEP